MPMNDPNHLQKLLQRESQTAYKSDMLMKGDLYQLYIHASRLPPILGGGPDDYYSTTPRMVGFGMFIKKEKIQQVADLLGFASSNCFLYEFLTDGELKKLSKKEYYFLAVQ